MRPLVSLAGQDGIAVVLAATEQWRISDRPSLNN